LPSPPTAKGEQGRPPARKLGEQAAQHVFARLDFGQDVPFFRFKPELQEEMKRAGEATFHTIGPPSATFVASRERTVYPELGINNDSICGQYSHFEGEDKLFGDAVGDDGLRPPAEGSKIAVHKEVLANWGSDDPPSKERFKAGQYVYFLSRNTENQVQGLDIGKIILFESRDLGGDASDGTKVVLLKRHVQAQHSYLEEKGRLSPSKQHFFREGEVCETRHYSYRRVGDIFGVAHVVRDRTGNEGESFPFHLCRFLLDDGKLVERVFTDKGNAMTSPFTGEFAMGSPRPDVQMSRKTAMAAQELSPVAGRGQGQEEEEEEVVKALNAINAASDAETLEVGGGGGGGHSEESSDAGESDFESGEGRASLVAKVVHQMEKENIDLIQTPQKPPKVKKRKLSELFAANPNPSPQSPLSGVTTASFPLLLGKTQRARWTQERFENAQRSLFISLMNHKAFAKSVAIKRAVLREGVRQMGIGDLGLIDHVIKALTEKRVTFSGHYIRKQHNDKGVLQYWLVKEKTVLSAEPDTDEETEDDSNLILSHRHAPARRGHFHSSGGGGPDLLQPSNAELPSLILSSVKEIRASVVALQEQVSGITKQAPSSDVMKMSQNQLTYNIILQHVQEEMAKEAETYRKEFANMVSPGQRELEQFKEEFGAKLSSCAEREAALTKEVDQLRTGLSESQSGVKGLRSTVLSLREAMPDKPEKQLAKQCEALKTEIAVMKAQQELFLVESGARIDELLQQNIQLREKLETLETNQSAISPQDWAKLEAKLEAELAKKIPI